MPHSDHSGPDGNGSKTGRKLGVCYKSKSEQKDIGEYGIGQGERRHSGGGEGKGKRLSYNKIIKK